MCLNDTGERQGEQKKNSVRSSSPSLSSPVSIALSDPLPPTAGSGLADSDEDNKPPWGGLEPEPEPEIGPTLGDEPKPEPEPELESIELQMGDTKRDAAMSRPELTPAPEAEPEPALAKLQTGDATADAAMSAVSSPTAERARSGRAAAAGAGADAGSGSGAGD